MMTVGVLYPPLPRRILMIGLGGGSISSYLGRYLPDAEIDTVEIDPGVVKAAKLYFGMKETPRVRYLEGDGRVFLNRRKDATWDLILVDAFHGGYVPFHLLTKEFYTLLKARLAPGGAVAFNVHDGTKLYASTLLTLRAVFPGLHLYPSGEGEMIVVTTTDAAPEPATLSERATAMQEKYGFRFPLPTLLARRTEKSGATHTGEMLTDDFAPVNLYDTMGDKKKKK
jgi:spermidine synthase